MSDFNCVLITADGAVNQPSDRGYVENGISTIAIPSAADSTVTNMFISNILRIAEPYEIVKFYDRDASVIGWYYQAYGVPPIDYGGLRPNSIASLLLPKNPVRGDIVIVKNGPSSGTWTEDPDVDAVSLAHTIWWYYKSGQDIGSVFGERGFVRMVGNII